MLRLDHATRAEHDAVSTVNARAQAIFDALVDPVSVKVYNGSDVVMGSGTLDTPWAILSGNTLTMTINAVTTFTVTTTAVPDPAWYLRIESGSRYVQGTFGLAGQARDFTWSLASWQLGQSGRIGTVVITTQAEGDPEFLAIPTVSAVQGRTASVPLRWFVRSALDLPFNWASQGQLPPGWNLTTDGYLNYDGSGAVGSADISVVATESPPIASVSRLADIPEVTFVETFAETEELGIYLLDPSNRVARGDLWWMTGDRLKNINGTNYTVAGPTPTLTVLAGDALATSGLTFDQTTARLIYDGAATGLTVKDRTVRLAWGVGTCDFRIRIVRPSTIYSDSAAALPASWAGIPVSATSVAWSSMRGLGSGGSDDATPRVVFFHTPTPRKDFFLPAADNNANFRYFYALGVPGTLTQLGLPWSEQQLSFETFSGARFRSWHYKNLALGNMGMQANVQESGFPTRWTIQKCDFLERTATGSGNSVGNSANWEPNPFPTQANDFRFWCVNMRMFEGGRNGNTEHSFYIETNGYTFGDWNNIRQMGGHSSSLIQVVLGHVRLRNSYLAATSNEADPFSRPTAASEMLDAHGVGEVVVYNNYFAGFNDQGNTVNGGTQTAHLANMQNRRPQKGSNAPQYPATSWDPPGHGVGPESPRLGAFPPGPATFANDAFWAAAGASIDDFTNPYLFRKSFAYNTVRALGPGKNQPLRCDGSHPCEPRVQLGGDTRMLGTHPDWFERNLIGLINNDFQSWASTSRIVETRLSQNVVFVEDGTKMVSRNVTIDTGQTGVVRVSLANDALCDATPEIKARIGFSNIAPSPEFDTWTEFTAVLLTPTSWSENPVKWPPAKWPATATGGGPHTELDAPENRRYTTRVIDAGGNSYSDQTNAAVPVPDWFPI